MSDLVLASRSPRRRELLAALGVAFEVVPSRADETPLPGLEPPAAIEEIAFRKAREVSQRTSRGPWVLGADTGVVVDGLVLGKPLDRAQAEWMLGSLSGRTHQVITGVALVGPERTWSQATVTEVTFQRLSERQIRWYASLEEPYDKAGGYAIQGQGAFLVESIRGSYTNVVGLPMAEVTRLLSAVGLAPWGADD